MEKVDALIKISETASQYQTWWDQFVDKIAYVLIWLGSLMWVFYLANGGDIIHCFPVLICPSPNGFDYNKSSVRTECDKYRNMTGHQGNQAVSIMTSFPSANHYVSTNIHCSEDVEGVLYLTSSLLVFTGFYLLLVSRDWYVNPTVESQINSFHGLIESCAKLRDWTTLLRIVSVYKELKTSNKPSDPMDPHMRANWEREKTNMFLKRRNMVNIVSKCDEEEIEQIRIFHVNMRRWSDNCVHNIQFRYIVSLFVNLVVVVSFSYYVTTFCKDWLSILFQETVCKTKLKYNVVYSEVRCSFAGAGLIFIFCISASGSLILLSLVLLNVVIQMWRIRHSLKDNYLTFYGLLRWRDHNSCAKKLTLFDTLDDTYIKQIVTDSKYPLRNLGCQKENGSELLTYVVEDALAPLPSCLFSKIVNDQKWCLKLENMADFQNSDFFGLDWLADLIELNISNCCNISCQLESHWIRKLQIGSCIMQNELKITDHEQADQHLNCWKIHNLEYLAICDPRPFNHLVLHFRNLSELLISNATISTSLDDLPDVKILTLKLCRLDEGVVIRRTSERLRSLTVVGCGITNFPILNCPNLHSLDLSENCIQFVKECDDEVDMVERQRKKKKEKRKKERKKEKKEEGVEREKERKRVERGDRLQTVHGSEWQDPNDSFPPLPKLQKIVLNCNQISSLDYNFLKSLKLQKGLTILDVNNNPLRREKMLSDISILYFFANSMSASHILDLDKYGPYLIEEEENELPFFPEGLDACMQLNTRVGNTRLPQLSNVSLLDGDLNEACSAKPSWVQFPPLLQHHIPRKQAVFYCDIRDNRTRRRMMVYMSCIAQLLQRNEGFHVCDAFNIPFDAATDIVELHIYLALRQGCVESNINKLRRIAKLAGDKEASVVIMCELEYGDPSSTQKTEETLGSLFACGGRVVRNILTEYPLFKTSSLFRQMALKLKKGKFLHETIDDLFKNYIF